MQSLAENVEDVSMSSQTAAQNSASPNQRSPGGSTTNSNTNNSSSPLQYRVNHNKLLGNRGGQSYSDVPFKGFQNVESSPFNSRFTVLKFSQN